MYSQTYRLLFITLYPHNVLRLATAKTADVDVLPWLSHFTNEKKISEQPPGNCMW